MAIWEQLLGQKWKRCGQETLLLDSWCASPGWASQLLHKERNTVGLSGGTAAESGKVAEREANQPQAAEAETE